MEETFDRLNSTLTGAASQVMDRLRPLLKQFKHMGPRQIMKLVLIIFVILCILPTGIMFPTPLRAPLYRTIEVPGYETMPAILYTLRRPRHVVPFSRMNEKNRAYLAKSFTLGGAHTPDDVSNGFRPPAPAIVFIQTPRDVAKHASKHPKGIQEEFGHLSLQVLETLSNLNHGNVDIWLVTPKSPKELTAFFKEYCWYRSVMLVPLGAAAMRTFQASYVVDKDNLFPIFINGMLLINPLFRETDVAHFTSEQKLLVGSLRAAVASNYGDLAKKSLTAMVPAGVTDTKVRVSVASQEFAKLVSKYFKAWNAK